MADRLQKQTSINGVEDSERVDGVVTQCKISDEPELEVNERVDDFNEEYFQDMLDMIADDGGADDGGTGGVKGEAEVRRNDEMADENEDDGFFDDYFVDEGVADVRNFKLLEEMMSLHWSRHREHLLSCSKPDHNPCGASWQSARSRCISLWGQLMLQHH